MAADDRTDGELLRDARRDPDAFGELYRRYEVVVAGYLQRRTRDPDLTADLTAETFATALLRAGRFRDDGAPALGWLLGIARHTLLRTWKKGRTERRACRRLGVDPIACSDASLERVEYLSDARALANVLARALADLPPEQSAAVRAHVIDERSYEELAGELEVPAATLRKRSAGASHACVRP